MKVLLVKPYNLSDHTQPSLGLGYLATAIRGTHEVVILDCIKEKIKPQAFGKKLDTLKPDIVGFQCYTFDLHNIQIMLKQCKERSLYTILGGPHPSALPERTMEFFGPDLDFLFHGEAEVGLTQLLEALKNKKTSNFSTIPGLAWKNNGNITINKKEFVENIDLFGMPAWDLIKPESYPENQHGAFFEKFPIAPIITTRGCPFLCTFCAGNIIAGKRIRKRSVDAILAEIQLLYHTHGIREFHIIDDNFTFNKPFAKDFLLKLKDLNLDISWAVPNGIRMDTLDDEILSLMKETGLYLISLGIESGSDRILEKMKKNMTVEKVRHYVRMIRKHDIDIAGFFILGFPTETVEDIKKTITLSLELDLLRANFFTYLPFPGTESYTELQQQGKLDTLDLKRFYFMNASFTPEGIGKQTLKQLQQQAFLRFFLRPSIFFRNIARVKSLTHAKFLLSRFRNWFFTS